MLNEKCKSAKIFRMLVIRLKTEENQVTDYLGILIYVVKLKMR